MLRRTVGVQALLRTADSRRKVADSGLQVALQNATDLHRVPGFAASGFVALSVEFGGDGSQRLTGIAEFSNQRGEVAIRFIGVLGADCGGDCDGLPNRRLAQVFASLPVTGPSRVSSHALSP